MHSPLKNIIVCCFALAASAVSAQPSMFDRLYAEFGAAKTDSAKLEVSFEIIKQLEDYQLDEHKKWLDTTAAFVAEMPGHNLACQHQVYVANWYRKSGDYHKAYELAIDCAKRFKAMGDDYSQCSALFEAGSSLAEYDPLAAVQVMSDAVGLGQSLNDDGLTSSCLANLIYAMKLAGLSQTDDYYQTLLSLVEASQKIGDREMILVNTFNLVEYYAGKGLFEQARLTITIMRTAIRGEEHEVFHCYPMVAEGNIFMAEGRPSQALTNYKKCWEIMDKYGIVDGRLELYPTIIKAYAAVGDFEKAFQFSEGFQLMKDSIFSLEKNRAVQQLQARYETEKKEAQIAAQKYDLARNNREKWLLATGLALLAGLAVLFWWQRQKTRISNIQLAASNEEIVQKNQKLDLLLRELHHRVKNNLQLVSSLLRLQSRQLGNEDAAAAIKAGQLRVEAMSLIHQRLYREEGLTLVNMQEFAQDLAEKTAFAFGLRTNDIDLDIDFHPAQLDVEKAMPISLIINELITNSFKYAFNQTNNPYILIKLSKQEEKLRLHYADNGPGLPNGLADSGSFGTKLIASLCGQLGGEPRHWKANGAHFEVIFDEN